MSEVTWVKRGTELRGSRWAEGRSLKYYKIHVFCLNFLNEVGTQEGIGVVIRFGSMREPACVKYQTSGTVLVSILPRSGVCAGESECRCRSRHFRPIDLLSPFRKRQVEGNHLNQLCDKATSRLIFFTLPVILGTCVDSLRPGLQTCNYADHEVGVFLNYTGNEGKGDSLFLQPELYSVNGPNLQDITTPLDLAAWIGLCKLQRLDQLPC